MDCTQDFGSSQLEETLSSEGKAEAAKLKLHNEEFPVLIGNNVVGRDAECCSIVVNNTTLSRKHAVIIVEDHRSHYIIDLDSKNKTRVNKKRLIPYERTRLSHQTLVEFGEVRAEYLILLEQDRDECHQVVPESEDEIVPETPLQRTKYGQESSSNSTSPTIFQMSSQCDCGDADTCGKLLGEPCGINFINKPADISNNSATFVDSKQSATLVDRKVTEFQELVPSNKGKDNEKKDETDLSGDETDAEDIFSNSVNAEDEKSINESSGRSRCVEESVTEIKSVEEDKARNSKESSSETDMSGDEETKGTEDFFNALTQVPPGGRNSLASKETLASGELDSVVNKVNEALDSNKEVLQESLEDSSNKKSLVNKGEAATDAMNKVSEMSPEKSTSDMLCDSVEESVHGNNIEVGVTNCLEEKNIVGAVTQLVARNENKLHSKVVPRKPPETGTSRKLSESLEENVHDNDTGVGVMNCSEEEYMFYAATQLVTSNETNLCSKPNFGDHEAKQLVDVESSSSCIPPASTKQSVLVTLDDNSIGSKTIANICDGVRNIDPSEKSVAAGTKHSQENLLVNSDVDTLCNAETQLISCSRGGEHPDDNDGSVTPEDCEKGSKEDIYNAATEVLICTNTKNETFVSKCKEEKLRTCSSSNIHLCASVPPQSSRGENETKSSDEGNDSNDFIFVAPTQLVPVVEEGSSHDKGVFVASTQLTPRSVERSRHEEQMFVAPTQLVPGVAEKCRLEGDLPVASSHLATAVDERSKHKEEVILNKGEGSPSKSSENIASVESDKEKNCELKEDTSKCFDESFFVASTQIVPCARFPGDTFDHHDGAKSPASTTSTYSSIHEAPTQCMDEIEGVCPTLGPRSSTEKDPPSAGCSTETQEREVILKEGSRDTGDRSPTHIEVSPIPHCESEGFTLILPSTQELRKTAHDIYGDSPSETDETLSPILQTRTRRIRSKNLPHDTQKSVNKRKLNLSTSDSDSVNSFVEESPDVKPSHKRSARTKKEVQRKKTASKQIVNKGNDNSKKENSKTVNKGNSESTKENSKAIRKEKDGSKKENSKVVNKGKDYTKKENRKDVNKGKDDSKKGKRKTVNNRKGDSKKEDSKTADEPNTIPSIENNSTLIQQEGDVENLPEFRSGRPSRLRKMTWKARDSYDCPKVVHEESDTLNVQCGEVNKKQMKERKHSLGKVDDSRAIEHTVSIMPIENNTPVIRNHRSSKIVTEKTIVSGRLRNHESRKEVSKDDVKSSGERRSYIRKSERVMSSEEKSNETKVNEKKIVLKEKIHESAEKTKITRLNFYETRVTVHRRNKFTSKERVADKSEESDQLHETKERGKEREARKSKGKINEKKQEREMRSRSEKEMSEEETIASTPKGRREQREMLGKSKEKSCGTSIFQREVQNISENATRRNTRRRNLLVSGNEPQTCEKSSSRESVSKKDDVRTKLKQRDSDSEAKKELVVLVKEVERTNEEQKRKTRFSTGGSGSPVFKLHIIKPCSDSPRKNKNQSQNSSSCSPSTTKGQKSVDNMKNTKSKNKKVSNVDTCASSGDSDLMLKSPVIKTRARRMPAKVFSETLKSAGSADVSPACIVEGKMDCLSDEFSTPCKKKKIVSSLSSSRDSDNKNAIAVDLKQSCLKDFEEQNVSSSPTIQRLKRTKQSDSSESLSCSGESTPKRSCRLTKKVHYNVMFTGVTATNTEENAIKELGGKFVEEIEDCAVLITDKVRRTFKFLCILGQGKPIVSSQWLEESRLKGHFLDPWNFIVKDRDAENKFKFSLEKSLKRASHEKLLDGYSVYATPSVLPPPGEMEGIVQCCGGNYLSREPSRTSWPKKSFVIASANDKKIVGKIRNKVTVVSPELILTGVLQQKLDFKEHSLKC